MKMTTLIVTGALAISSTAGFAHDPSHDHESGHGHSAAFAAGEPGDPKQPARIVLVTMMESGGRMLFTPSRQDIKKGDQVKFMLRNAGAVDHEFVLTTPAENLEHATAMAVNPDMTHNEPNGKTVKPKQSAELIWRFTNSGEFEYACLIPGHREAGMTGTVSVK